jgi:hypothetical protein
VPIDHPDANPCSSDEERNGAALGQLGLHLFPLRSPRLSRSQAIDDPRVELAHLCTHTFSGVARNATPLRDSRATPHGGS